ncbi:ABC transporter ATP-binding protein [Halomonas sp. BM-2019]|uniref:ABC transporter ATP-binding protein n=1 Tax=Halomonas sp. BM-2019 TaxID=2811227 RepID=UPI001B3C4A52|nr:MAG: ABC transporter ATP-binding protein [Halomonas sp. BM-2019]
MNDTSRMDMTPILHAEHLTKQVRSGDRQLTILSDLALSVFPGESVAILGQSGAGKSTLLGLLAGLDLPTGGELTMFGQPLAALDEDGRARLRAGRVGFVFQNFQLLPTLTALENVMLPLELSPRPGTQARAREWLERVGLGERLDHLPKQLSGGEQQRVALARAFVTGAELVFADEPTGNLDPDTGEPQGGGSPLPALRRGARGSRRGQRGGGPRPGGGGGVAGAAPGAAARGRAR